MTPAEIRAARQSLGMTQSQFADALGVAPQTVRRWEMSADRNSRRAPSEQTLRLIRVLLATSNRAGSGGNPGSGLAMGGKL